MAALMPKVLRKTASDIWMTAIPQPSSTTLMLTTIMIIEMPWIATMVKGMIVVLNKACLLNKLGKQTDIHVVFSATSWH